MAVVSIIVTSREAKVRSPFQAKDLIREMPVRSWDPNAKCWVIPASDVAVLQVVLEQAGYRVVVTHDEQDAADLKAERERLRRERERWERERAQRQRDRRTAPPPRSGRSATGSWAEQMFIALSPELAEKAYKALSRALHPDVGGSTEQMQLLNAARDRHGRQK